MIYYVATLARYVLADAENEDQARKLGHAARYDLYADVREPMGKDAPINILTIRPATDGEIGLQAWHDEKAASERTYRPWGCL